MTKIRLGLTYKVLLLTMLIITVVLTSTTSVIYVQNMKALERQGLALTEAVRVGMENAVTARQTAEQILDKEMIGQSHIISLLHAKGTSYEELKQLAQVSGLLAMCEGRLCGGRRLTLVREGKLVEAY